MDAGRVLRIKAVQWIVVHCSDSAWGCAAVIDSWHRQRGWESIGYHWVVGNGRPTVHGVVAGFDGRIERGRPEDVQGAHCVGINAESLGVCLIGKGEYTPKQLTRAAALVAVLQREHPGSKVVGHYETDSGRAQGKKCPLLDMTDFRSRVDVAHFIGEVEDEVRRLRKGPE